MTSLNPVMRIGDQITEAVRLHAADRQGSRNKAVEMLRLVRTRNRSSGRGNIRISFPAACASAP